MEKIEKSLTLLSKRQEKLCYYLQSLEAYLEFSQTSTMELVWENNLQNNWR